MMNENECLESGGHYWKPQVPGQRNECGRCGYLGLTFEGALNAYLERALFPILDPVNETFEVAFDIDAENAPEFLYGKGVVVHLVPGVDTPHRLAIMSSVSAGDSERLIMAALTAFVRAWEEQVGGFVEAGDDRATRAPEIDDRTWRPWPESD